VKTPDAIASVRRVAETLDAHVPALVHAEWRAEMPWVVQGTTTHGVDRTFDLGLFSEGSPAEDVRMNWKHLLAATGMRAARHARQVHGAEVRRHGDAREESRSHGLSIVDDCDGHATREPGMLLAVSAADCVPIFVVDPGERTVAVLHAGWRGVVAGMLERGLTAFASERMHGLRVHLGPAICGRCYEVGPEVFDALGLRGLGGPALLDLREVLARRAVALGVSASHLTISEHCTRCTGSDLFSHRGGDRGRQVGYLGIRV
jgi:YfiH family protein